MEQSVKNRIVGLIVVIAILAIVVPMLFTHAKNREIATEQLSLNIPQKPQVFHMDLTGKKPDASTAAATAVQKPNATHVNSMPALNNPSAGNTQAWVLQTGSFAQMKPAQALLMKLQKQGFTAYVQAQHTVKGNRKSPLKYVVLVGPILSQADAQLVQTRLKQNFHYSADLKEYQP